MDYYQLRSRVFHEIKTHLQQRQELKDQGMNPPPFNLFIQKMIEKYGVTKKMIRVMVEDLVPGATLKNNEIVMKDD